METNSLLKKVRKIEIKTKGLSTHIFAGEYHTIFKGKGMAFSEVRQYQAGDDIRKIDWNVTARYNSPLVKVFEEEREITVILLIDVSASGNFGTNQQFKKELASEILSDVKNCKTASGIRSIQIPGELELSLIHISEPTRLRRLS